MSSSRAPAGTASTARLLRDRALLAQHYPKLRFEISKTAESPISAIATGPLAIMMPDGTIEAVEVRIEFARIYPTRAPRAYDVAKRWTPERARHIEPDGHFCLFLRALDEPDMSDESSLILFMNDLEQFLRQQFILDSQRRFNPAASFPGPEWPHGNLAYAVFAARLLRQEEQHVSEALWQAAVDAPDRHAPCPCGAGLTHEQCHFGTCRKLRRALHEGRLHHHTYESLVQETKDSI